jgi:hypothetical protein
MLVDRPRVARLVNGFILCRKTSSRGILGFEGLCVKRGWKGFLFRPRGIR